jgi:hypothetical protein
MKNDILDTIILEAVKTTIGQKVGAAAMGALGLGLGTVGSGSYKVGAATGAAMGAAQLAASRSKNKKRATELQGMIDRGSDLLMKWKKERNPSDETKKDIARKEEQMRKWKAELSKIQS